MGKSWKDKKKDVTPPRNSGWGAFKSENHGQGPHRIKRPQYWQDDLDPDSEDEEEQSPTSETTQHED